MKLTKLQEVISAFIKDGQSVLLIAPTGIGKTLAVLSHLTEAKGRIVFGLPLRALATTIAEEASGLKRNGNNIRSVVHHGDIQDSWLFSEEVVVTTYDQIVCAVPGLPLSLPSSAGHAVAGALLMSTLILDEAHLAWSISPEALTLLLAIVESRQKFGLQTILMTATMPVNVAQIVAERLGLKLIVAGENGTEEDEGLKLRQRNRSVEIVQRAVKDRRKNEDEPEVSEVAQTLSSAQQKSIYFGNTVRRLQLIYDILCASGVDNTRITVLHNQMPKALRSSAENEARQRFGKENIGGDWILLANQVAEAGLDISAPLVLSDPAPVDTLIQRAGRCARWFRDSKLAGRFEVLDPPTTKLKDWAIPYQKKPVGMALAKLEALTKDRKVLDWNLEKHWINASWLGLDKEGEQKAEIDEHLDRTTFALNLFDRAAQLKSPRTIASAFREILSVQVAVFDDAAGLNADQLLAHLKAGGEIESCSVSLKTAHLLRSKSKEKAALMRQGDELGIEGDPAFVGSGDLLLVPSSAAYLHPKKGLCIRRDNESLDDAQFESKLLPAQTEARGEQTAQTNPQSLWSHTKGVMERVEARFQVAGDYRATLLKILERLERHERAEGMLDAIANMAVLATGFHDIGKSGIRWQTLAHELDPDSAEELIGRTRNTRRRMGIPHTPPAFGSAVAALKAAVGDSPELDPLIRVLSLAAARHHSSALDPSSITSYSFDPIPDLSRDFIGQLLTYVGIDASPQLILDAACRAVSREQVPLVLPNDDLFPIYALVGRAILLSDREDAAGKSLEDWTADAKN